MYSTESTTWLRERQSRRALACTLAHLHSPYTMFGHAFIGPRNLRDTVGGYPHLGARRPRRFSSGQWLPGFTAQLCGDGWESTCLQQHLL
jgi:hypothetical protein